MKTGRPAASPGDDVALLLALIDQACDTIEIVDPHTGRFLHVNEAGCAEHGYSRREYLRLTVFDMDPMVDEETFTRTMAEVREAGSLALNGVHRRKDGSTFPVEVKLSHVRLENEYIVASVRDVSARQEWERRVQQSLDTQAAIASILRLSLGDAPLDDVLRHVLETVLSVPWVSVQKAGAIFLADDESESLVLRAEIGLSEAVKEQCARVPFGVCLCGRAAQSSRVVHANDVDENHENACDSGPHGHLCVPIARGGELLGVLNTYLGVGQGRVARDEALIQAVADTLAGIIVRRRAEEEARRISEQLVHTRRLESIGRLAGGIAHDFNNLLTVINGCAEFALDELGHSESAREDIQEIHDAGRRAAKLTRQLLAFGGKQVLEPTVLNLNDVVRDIERMLGRLLGEDVVTLLKLAEALGEVEVDRSQIEQVIVNLAMNARHAMPQGGTLTIETADVTCEDLPARQRPAEASGRCVRLSVTDTGCGMDAATLARVFEPFFTTKPAGKGTGLGLSTVHGIAKQSGGDVVVESAPGRGTTVKVYLPRTDEVPDEIGPGPAAEAPGGDESILIVEDDEPVRRLTYRVLGRAGYRLLSAANADEALRRLDAHPGSIDLVLTDIVMPGMSGLELARRATGAGRSPRFLFMSGHADESLARHGAADLDVHRIAKPFTASALTRRVRDVLDASPGPTAPAGAERHTTPTLAGE